MSELSERTRAFMIVSFACIGSLFLAMLTAAALYTPEEVFKSTFHVAVFVILVVISIVTGLTGVIVEYLIRRQSSRSNWW